MFPFILTTRDPCLLGKMLYLNNLSISNMNSNLHKWLPDHSFSAFSKGPARSQRGCFWVPAHCRASIHLGQSPVCLILLIFALANLFFANACRFFLYFCQLFCFRVSGTFPFKRLYAHSHRPQIRSASARMAFLNFMFLCLFSICRHKMCLFHARDILRMPTRATFLFFCFETGSA